MKKILNMLMAAGLAVWGASCSSDLDYEPGGVTPVKASVSYTHLTLPTN